MNYDDNIFDEDSRIIYNNNIFEYDDDENQTSSINNIIKQNSSESNNYDKNELKLMKLEYKYPDTDDENLQSKIYKKREFYYHKIKDRPVFENYNEIKEHRDIICNPKDEVLDHQATVSNFINPDTPYKGLLLFHNVGTGKTCAGIAIAEKFKLQAQKYNTKIYVLVSGGLVKENWKKEILKCTGETYKKYVDKTVLLDEQEKERQNKMAINNALQFYRFLSYKSFYKRVLGEKIIDKKVVKGQTVKLSYKKTDEGEFERDLADERIHNLNNTLIIVDEAHNLTNNSYGDALKKIIKNSTNLRILLLTATPMKNFADDILDLINFIRPSDSPLERDKIFTSQKNHEMELKKDGLKYFKNMVNGYVSHIRGADPITYAKRIDKGEIPIGLLFTKLVRCKMSDFQRQVYDMATQEGIREEGQEIVSGFSVNRKSEAASNFSFPGLTQNKKNITGYYGREGIDILKNQIRSHYDALNKKIGTDILDDVDDNELLYLGSGGKQITGKIFNIKYLRNFSTKFYKCLRKLNRLVLGDKGVKTAFIYSNLVKVGIELFQETLIQNGYLEYQEESANYRIDNNTVCYLCGKTYKEHTSELYEDNIQSGGKKKKTKYESDTDDESDDEDYMNKKRINNIYDYDVEDENTDGVLMENKTAFIRRKHKQDEDFEDDSPKESKNIKIPKHDFYPATFITITGKSAEDTDEYVPEKQFETLKSVFNNVNNKTGKYIKFVLGSKVMNEGISLANVGEVHILDAYFNLGRIDQVVGRGIRWCSHYKVMSEEDQYPSVNVYKYAVCLNNNEGLSSEEELYQKAEKKYLLIKKLERAMKEVAIDCPLNQNANMFREEVEEFEGCRDLVNKENNDNKSKQQCPLICDYTQCDYKCEDIKLNANYYDPKRKMYKKISKDELDYSTFNNNLARTEIQYAKNKIKELYLKKYNYTVREIVEYIKRTYDKNKIDLFDEFFVYKALDELIPVTENDFNNFKDTLVDKYNRSGYLIYVGKYYIFQPFSQNEKTSMHYRTSFETPAIQSLSLYNYLKHTDKYNFLKNKMSESSSKVLFEEDNKDILDNATIAYDFESNFEYYENRDEFKYVGIIDKQISKKKSTNIEDIQDVFKIREKRSKILDKKRATGVFTFLGGVCTSRERSFLMKLAQDLNIDTKNINTRLNICNVIRDRLAELEKYSKGKNKITYLIVPANHPKYKFPYNLEDRKDYIINKLSEKIRYKYNLSVDENKDGTYIINITKNDSLIKYDDFIKKLGFFEDNNNYVMNID